MYDLLKTILLVYLVLVNAAGLLFMFVDKQKAQRGQWRIPEATLMLTAAIGGSVGSLLGMYLFRHKTRHSKFTVGIPLILVLQVALAIWLW
ncbi:MAG TPA: DUF1294 domain-containing protein [Candidatus Faecousia faecigallinarum]|nr:DUF1294 domain-containing protein [Candidatus Faecousia faecigallinarum]